MQCQQHGAYCLQKLINWVLNWPFFDCESILWVKSLVYALWIFMTIFFFPCAKPSLFKAIEKTNLQGGNVIPTNIIPCQGWLFNIVYFTHNTSSRRHFTLTPKQAREIEATKQLNWKGFFTKAFHSSATKSNPSFNFLIFDVAKESVCRFFV